mmetsp:Transcript_19200/g.44857  ORF Transcript_19200/g.44857 Transcript_19200/m.44857 type:complete len:208 (-) Transcript_19200:1336-1959(-)
MRREYPARFGASHSVTRCCDVGERLSPCSTFLASLASEEVTAPISVEMVVTCNPKSSTMSAKVSPKNFCSYWSFANWICIAGPRRRRQPSTNSSMSMLPPLSRSRRLNKLQASSLSMPMCFKNARMCSSSRCASNWLRLISSCSSTPHSLKSFFRFSMNTAFCSNCSLMMSALSALAISMANWQKIPVTTLSTAKKTNEMKPRKSNS